MAEKTKSITALVKEQRDRKCQLERVNKAFEDYKQRVISQRNKSGDSA